MGGVAGRLLRTPPTVSDHGFRSPANGTSGDCLGFADEVVLLGGES
jgi:hypothetical protein